VRETGGATDRPEAGEPDRSSEDLIEELQTQAAQLEDQAAELEAINDELGASEARLKGIIESALDAIITTDAQGRVIDWNSHAERVFGYTGREAAGRQISELIIPERYREQHIRGMEHYLATGEGPILNRRIEIEALRRGGEIFPVELTVAAARWGAEVIFTSFIRDITEGKRDERRRAARAEVTRILAESESLSDSVPRILRGISEALGWVVGTHWVLDEANDVLVASTSWIDPSIDAAAFEAASATTRFARGQGLPGRVWERAASAWIEDIDADPNFPRKKAALHAGVRAAFAFPIRAGDRILAVMEFFDDEVASVDEALLTTMDALGYDIGQFVLRRIAEVKLEERNEWQRFLARVGARLAVAAPNYQDTLEKVGALAVPALADWCSVYAATDGGEIRRLVVVHRQTPEAAAAETIAARGGRPKPAHPVIDVIRTGEATLIQDVDERLLAPVAETPEQLEVLKKLGANSAMIVPLNARGRVVGAILLVSTDPERTFGRADLDVALDFAGRAAVFLDNARLYRDAQVANTTKAEFLATMSHELRTPLNAMLGYTDLLLQGIPEEISEPVAEYIRRVSFSAKHLLQLIEEILTYSRLEAGSETVSLQSITMDEVAEEVKAIMEPLTREKSLRLLVDVAEADRPVTTDPRKLRQILLNLLSNAVKFTEEGEVELRAAIEDDELILTVRDTGVGIEADHLDRIFEPFWQVEQSNTRTAHGTGLGLTVTQRFVKLLGGQISAESELGKGSTFEVRIPTEQPPESEE
jgi:PAS domain S-box-containing protein